MTTLREKLGRRDLITYEDLEKQYTLQSDPEGFFHIIPVTRTAKIYEIDFDLSENGSVRIVLLSDYPGNSFSFPISSSEGASCQLYFKQTGTGRLINGMVRKCFEFVGSEPADS